MKKFFCAIAMASLVTCIPKVAMAGEAENRVIDLVKQTYGIGKLKTFSIYTDYRVGAQGQGYTPGYSEHTPVVYDINVDLVNQRGSSEVWGGPHANYNYRSFNTDDGTVEIDYVHKTYELDTDGTYYGTIGGAIRRSDTLLAYELVNRSTDLVVKKTVNYHGNPHTVATLSLPGWIPMDIYVNRDTGHITKMERPSRGGDRTLHFQFGDFQKTSGVTYGKDYQFYIDDFLVEYAKDRRIKVNKVGRKTFKLDRDLTPQREKIDRSEMTIDAIGDTVLYVGQGIGYTAFIDAGTYVIGAGATAGLAGRIDAYKAYMKGNANPLRYFVVNHHHVDHLRGLSDMNLQEVTFIVPKMAGESLRDAVDAPIDDSRIQFVSDKFTMGPVEVYNITTGHVAEFALTYIPEAKTVIQVDHLGALFVDGGGFANRDSVTLKAAIDKLGLDVEKIISLHNRKVESWRDFSHAVATYNPDPCPTKRPICQ